MTSEPVVSMRELELESAELLPSRETLCVSRCYYSSSSYSFGQAGYGNTAQSGPFDVAIANGSFDNILSLGSGNLL